MSSVIKDPWDDIDFERDDPLRQHRAQAREQVNQITLELARHGARLEKSMKRLSLRRNPDGTITKESEKTPKAKSAKKARKKLLKLAKPISDQQSGEDGALLVKSAKQGKKGKPKLSKAQKVAKKLSKARLTKEERRVAKVAKLEAKQLAIQKSLVAKAARVDEQVRNEQTQATLDRTSDQTVGSDMIAKAAQLPAAHRAMHEEQLFADEPEVRDRAWQALHPVSEEAVQ